MLKIYIEFIEIFISKEIKEVKNKKRKKKITYKEESLNTDIGYISDNISISNMKEHIEFLTKVENAFQDCSSLISIQVDANNVQKGNEFNRAGFTVPWNITAKVNGATAQKVKIKVDLSDNLDYLSHEASVGEFNPETGIWDIGDLESGSSPLLIIMTKLKSDGRFKVTVDGTSDSQDADS